MVPSGLRLKAELKIDALKVFYLKGFRKLMTRRTTACLTYETAIKPLVFTGN